MADMAVLLKGNWWFSTPWDGMGFQFRRNSPVKFRGQKTERFQDWHGLVCVWKWVVSLWVIVSPCLSERGWIATARDSESRRYMMVKQVGSPTKINASTFFGCHLTISPRSAALIVSQAIIFPKKSLKVPFFLPSLWFSWAEARAWERTLEPPKRARCVGWFAWRKWGPLGLVMAMAWLVDEIFIQFYLDCLGILEFRGWTVLNQVFWGMILGENGDIWIDFMRFWPLVIVFFGQFW